jgi:hypothetical protein
LFVLETYPPLVGSGTCAESGYDLIQTQEECLAAAKASGSTLCSPEACGSQNYMWQVPGCFVDVQYGNWLFNPHPDAQNNNCKSGQKCACVFNIDKRIPSCANQDFTYVLMLKKISFHWMFSSIIFFFTYFLPTRICFSFSSILTMITGCKTIKIVCVETRCCVPPKPENGVKETLARVV